MSQVDRSLISTTEPLTQLLRQWQEQRLLSALDRHFALEMAALHHSELNILSDDMQQLYLLLTALLSQQLSQQHTCLPIKQIVLENPLREQTPQCQLLCTHSQLIELISQLPGIGKLNIGEPNIEKNHTPMVLDSERLYLQRYHHYETQVATLLKNFAQPLLNLPASNTLSVVDRLTNDRLEALFSIEPSAGREPSADKEPSANNKGSSAAKAKINWQKVATATAYTQRLAVITGGPGTGKTTTVTKLLLLLCQDNELNIRLVAPTGKAAARLSESIKNSKLKLTTELANAKSPLDLTKLSLIPEEAATLHRLLGALPNSAQFRHHQENPLRLDLLVVDEASMVDLSMMYKLLSALPKQARLILLGDQDQLASVEAGAVLADICAGLAISSNSISNPESSSAWQMRYSKEHASHLSQLTNCDLTPYISPSAIIGDSLCMLTHSYRFNDTAGIGQLADAVNRSDSHKIKTVWSEGFKELIWIEHHNRANQTNGLSSLLTQAVKHYRRYLEMANTAGNDPIDIIDSYNSFRILLAIHAGEYGVEGINNSVTKALKQANLIDPTQEFYLGRPIIIQSNDYNLGIFNGDIGLILNDVSLGYEQANKPTTQRLMAHFIQADGTILKVLPARLPPHDTCYAMTVHKSQGSEFTNVAFVLPPKPSVAQRQLLTKELLYTAITRAKEQFICLGSQPLFIRSALQATQRASGLANRLWGLK